MVLSWLNQFFSLTDSIYSVDVLPADAFMIFCCRVFLVFVVIYSNSFSTQFVADIALDITQGL